MSRLVTEQIFLVPGFFGFVNIGELTYFSHVKHFLLTECHNLGKSVTIHSVPTHPTASLRKRAYLLFEHIQKKVGEGEDPIHLIGHSTGGLDARLLASPKVNLGTDLNIESYTRRIRSVIMVSTPHFGTPLASFFSSILGKELLRLLSVGTSYIIRFGRLPLLALIKLATLFMRIDNILGFKASVADQLFDQLLADFSPERQDAVRNMVEQVGEDCSLLAQLTPEGTDLFNSTTLNRPGVLYGSVVTATSPIGLHSLRRVGLDPYAQATHLIFTALQHLTAQARELNSPTVNKDQTRSLMNCLGLIPPLALNDGIVPTLSQVWGQVIHATWADHLDVIGHFCDLEHQPPHFDWLASGTSFNRKRFEALWTDVASALFCK